MDTKLSYALLCLFASLRLAFSASLQADLESVPDLEKSMYSIVDGFPCVRLLNLQGEIGCSNPGNGKVVVPIVRHENAKNIVRPSALLVSSDEYDGLLTRISSDPHFARNVAGVLVKSELQDKLKGFSPDRKFPQAEFSPYDSRTYQWNPNVCFNLVGRNYVTRMDYGSND